MHQGPFRKSSFCGSGACVEVAELGDQFLVRDGKNPTGPVLQFTLEEWTAFLDGATNGEFAPSGRSAQTAL